MKKFLVIIIISILLFGLADFALAQGRELEVDYPEIRGERPEEVTTPVTEYFKYIFNFLIWISGLIALVVLIQAGFQYLTSAGSPERINDAKSKIGAALLGILILFGSYLILTTINPNLIVFHLPRLRPIISQLPAGVLVCKEEVEVGRARQLANNFKHAEEYFEQKIIAKELNQIFEDISGKCYTIITAGDIRSGFDNKITNIYFIPGEQTINEERYIALYGAVIYEDSNFEGKSQPMYEHLEKGPGIYSPAKYGPDEPVRKITISQLSSIKPFTIQWNPDPNWEVILYEDYNFNRDSNLIPEHYSLEKQNLLREVPLRSSGSNEITGPEGSWSQDWSPKSIKIEGDLLVILFTGDEKSEVFFAETDANLEDNLNIVEWIDCRNYESETSKECKGFAAAPMGGGAAYTYKCCAQAAATRMLIISAKPY